MSIYVCRLHNYEYNEPLDYSALDFFDYTHEIKYTAARLLSFDKRA